LDKTIFYRRNKCKEADMSDKVMMHEERILEEWAQLIQDGQGKAQDIYREIAKLIEESRAPGISSQMVTVKVQASMKDLFSKRETERQYLRVLNENMKDFKFYIGARDYGDNLDISWYLTCEPSLMKHILSSAMTKGESGNALSFALNLFERQDLKSYVTVAHHSVLDAVSNVMKGLGQDPSTIDRKSKGFLGVS
jgi:hypothetical protein